MEEYDKKRWDCLVLSPKLVFITNVFPDISDFISAKSPPMILVVDCKSLLRLIVDTDEGAETGYDRSVH